MLASHLDWRASALARFERRLSVNRPVAPTELLPCNRWIASSVLQKAIRRSWAELASRAALTLLSLYGAAAWRRLIAIAYEDVGAADPATVVEAVAVCSSPRWRAQVGDEVALAGLASLLADAPKDRSADFLMWIGMDHSSVEPTRRLLGQMPVDQRHDILADRNVAIEDRAAAAWFCSGLDFPYRNRVGRGDLARLMLKFEELGVAPDFANATLLAARMTREPYCVLALLVWLSMGGCLEVIAQQVPNSETIDGIPLCAFDEHTRLGKKAINRLVRENIAVQACLKHYVRKARWTTAAQHAAFYMDGAPVAQRLDWSESRRLESLGIETELINAEVPLRGIAPLREAMAGALDCLNDIRRELWIEARTTGEA